jgi:hypothetical protein
MRSILAVVVTLVLAGAAPLATGAQPAGWKVVRDGRTGLEFSVPGGWSIDAPPARHGTRTLTLRDPAAGGDTPVVRVVLQDLDELYRALLPDGAPAGAGALGVYVARTYCDLDGPVSSVQCPTAARTASFASAHGVGGQAVTLREIERFRGAASARSRERGPIYAFDVSSPRVTRVAVFGLVGPGAAPPAHVDALTSIARTVRRLPTGR